MTPLFCAVLFLSGAAALLFETLLFRRAGVLLGSSVWATAIVTASFMGGLAVGNAWAARRGGAVTSPLRFYALLEVAVAVSGICLVVWLPVLSPVTAPLVSPWLDRPVLLNTARLGTAFLLLLVPASAMGATLPILARALSRLEANFGRVLGLLYGWNTLGAVAGALCGEFILVESLGLRGTALVAGGLNGVAALGALLLAGRVERGHSPAAAAAAASKGRGTRWLAAAFLSGALLLALEGAWFRALQLFVLGTSQSFAVMLAVVLLGIGAGGLVASAVLGSGVRADRILAATALATGSVTAWTYAALPDALAAFAGRVLLEPGEVLWLGLRLMLPTSFGSGMLFTLLGAAFKAVGHAEAEAAGTLTLANTLGAMLGALASGLLLLPQLGIEQSVFWLAAGYFLVALLAATPAADLPLRPRAGLGLALAAYVAVMGLFPFGLMRNHLQPLSARQWQSDGSRVVARREGLTETIVYLVKDLLGEPVYHRLVTNSFSMSGTQVSAARYMRLFVYWPVALHPSARRALLISYGVGVTARSLTETRELERIDVVDTSADILELGRIVFPAGFPLDDERVRVHVEDGRFFLASGSGLYDIITGEPPPPKNVGIAALYSREHFGLIRKRLAPGGLVTYWLPVYQLHLPDTRAIVRAFCDVFADCSLWTGSGFEWMLAGSAGNREPVREQRFLRQWNEPVAASLREVGVESPELLGTTFIADAPFLREWTDSAAPLTDDHPLRVSPRIPYGLDPEYVRLMDIPARRERFARSALVRSLWPEPLLAPTLDAFEVQALLDRTYAFAVGMPPMSVDDLEALLRGTQLRTPVLHALWSSERQVDIARRARARGVSMRAVDEALTIDALADRDYARAAQLLRPWPTQPGASGILAGLVARVTPAATGD